ncbi:hypothetical protein [Aminobacter sp. HY435]|uniref:hypothetical protein n=1 Tax=Aminobacter sp. HY435 TaxID=2970917 RepID=UPI0022B9873B|nr:hypothetical protein [Aminobacter sp. HY435]
MAWLCLVMVLSARGIDGGVSFLLGFTPSDSVFYFVLLSAIVGGVTILWGLWLLLLAYSRSARFPRQFTLWQSALIVVMLVKQGYILIAPDFAVTAWTIAWAVGEVAVGVAMICLVNSRGATQTLVSGEQDTTPRPVVIAIAAVLGVFVGGAAGAALGLVVGSVISEATDMSCFEGGCGYFAIMVGIVGCLVGAVVGGIFAAWLAARRRRAA